jgi:hypothetical protein
MVRGCLGPTNIRRIASGGSGRFEITPHGRACHYERKPASDVVSMPDNEPYASSYPPCQNAKAVMLDSESQRTPDSAAATVEGHRSYSSAHNDWTAPDRQAVRSCLSVSRYWLSLREQSTASIVEQVPSGTIKQIASAVGKSVSHWRRMRN